VQITLDMYNAYGNFTLNNSESIYVYYDSGIPTAQSGDGGYGGSIGDGGTYPNVRVLLHESSHWLGTGTYSAYWGGPAASALIQQFEGVGAGLAGDGQGSHAISAVSTDPSCVDGARINSENENSFGTTIKLLDSPQWLTERELRCWIHQWFSPSGGSDLQAVSPPPSWWLLRMSLADLDASSHHAGV